MGLFSRFKKKSKTEKEYAKEFIDSIKGNGNYKEHSEIIEKWIKDYPNDANVYYADVIMVASGMLNKLEGIFSKGDGGEINYQTLLDIYDIGESKKPGWEEGAKFLKQQAQLQMIAVKLAKEQGDI